MVGDHEQFVKWSLFNFFHVTNALKKLTVHIDFHSKCRINGGLIQWGSTIDH